MKVLLDFCVAIGVISVSATFVCLYMHMFIVIVRYYKSSLLKLISISSGNIIRIL